MQKMKRINPYKLILIMIVLTFVIFMTSGITLSYINSKEDTKQISAIVFNEGDLAINYLDGNEIKIEYPFNKSYEYSFSITNTGNNKIYYSMYLKNVVVFEKNIKVRLLNDKKDELEQITLVKGENLLQSVKVIEPGVTDRYKLIVDNKKNKTDISALISINNESNDNKTLQDLILSDNTIIINSLTNINEKANTKEGLIKGQDDYGTSYYFRGNINNNYIKINDMLFRIVRINGDGTIRIILDEKINNMYSFNTENIEEKTLLSNLESSSIYKELNNWYDEHLKDYDDLFIGSSFCSDNNFNTINKDIKYSDSSSRYSNNNYTLRCFTTSFLSKVGLISLDELLYAGASLNEANQEFYLYNKDIPSTWTMTSYSLKDKMTMYLFDNDGSIKTDSIDKTYSIRPVLNVKATSEAKGEGTLENPYILVK